MLASPGADIRSTFTNPQQDPHLWLIPADPGGDVWANAMAGDGIYAHVEQVAGQPGLYNIEYWLLYAYNQGLNTGKCDLASVLSGNFDLGNHNGDLTVVTLVYSQSCDQIIRATFVRHGKIIANYVLSEFSGVEITTLSGASGETARARRLSEIGTYY